MGKENCLGDWLWMVIIIVAFSDAADDVSRDILLLQERGLVTDEGTRSIFYAAALKDRPGMRRGLADSTTGIRQWYRCSASACTRPIRRTAGY